MEDTEILDRIGALVDEEHSLRDRHGRGGLNEDERDRLERVEVQLDQCWDLLRQRRARRHADEPADEAHARDADVVEGYQQ